MAERRTFHLTKVVCVPAREGGGGGALLPSTCQSAEVALRSILQAVHLLRRLSKGQLCRFVRFLRHDERLPTLLLPCCRLHNQLTVLA